MFTTELEAALAYDKVAIKIPRRNLNFETEEAREAAMMEASSAYVEQPVQCESCLKMFTSMKGLQGHMPNCKGDEDNFIEKRSKHSLEAARKSAHSMNFVNEMARIHNNSYDPDYAPGLFTSIDSSSMPERPSRIDRVIADATAEGVAAETGGTIPLPSTLASGPPASAPATLSSRAAHALREHQRARNARRKVDPGYRFVQRHRIPSPSDRDYDSHRNVRMPTEFTPSANYYTTEAEAPAVLPYLSHIRPVYDHNYGVPPLVGDIH